MTFEWTIYVRDQAGNRIGEVDDYAEATLTPVFNDVGTWSILVDRRVRQAANLTQPGFGIIAARNGVTVLSGPATHRQHTVDMDNNHVQISGVTDDVWLKRRVVSPSPTESFPPYTVQAFDVRTGPASTVLRAYVDANAGPGAIAPRRVPGLTIAPDPVIGAPVSGNGRWDNLLAFLQPLAISGGVGFRIIQVGDGGMQFQVFATAGQVPADRPATAQFSIDLGNLAGFEYESTAPEANYVYVGGAGINTARTIQEFPFSAAIGAWGRIEGDFVDRRDTTDATQITQAGTDALTQHGEQASLRITPIETPTSIYGTHYKLGDKVTVQLEGPAATPYAESGQITDILRSVEIKLTVDGPQTVTPSIGTAARNDVYRMFRAFRALSRRVNNLERQ
jgi:hypothetical protein